MSRPIRSGYCRRHHVNVYDDSCQQCDDENPIHTRSFIGEIRVSEYDLTTDGERDADIGWGYAIDIINDALKGANAEFIDWEE